MFATIVVIGAGLGLTFTRLQGTEADSHDRSTQATALVNGLRTVDGLEWRAVAGEPIDELSVRLDSETARILADLGSRGADPRLVELEGDAASYLAAVREEFDALIAGDRDRAMEIDETAVDPRFEEALALALQITDEASQSAAAARRAVVTLTWALSVGMGLLLGGALWLLLGRRDRIETERRDAESLRRLRGLVDGSRDIITIVSGEDRLTVVSPGLGVLGGASPNTAPESVAELLPPHALIAWDAAEERLKLGDRTVVVELVLPRPDGSVAHVEAHGSRLGDSADERVWVWRDVTAAKEFELQLSHQAFHDSLTGVANGVLLRDRTGHALALAARTGSPLCLLFCDLDDFKSVNDSLGHTEGDELLKIVTTRLAGCIREGDTLARLGGDEFAILLEDADTELAVALAERIIRVVSSEIALGTRVIFPSISIGVATANPAMTTDELVRNADIAMYAAKRAGKGRVERYEPGMHNNSKDLLDLRTDLRIALENQQLTLHYQSTVSLETGAVEGVEALVRWHHPERGLLGPAEFIPVAEASGIISPLGKWVLAEACRTAARLAAEREKPLLMHVNLSPLQLADPTLVQTVGEILAETGLTPSLLVLEVTEGCLLDSDTAVQRLEQLHDLGVLIAIDDFGTGYTSISYLQRLPIDILKIDRSFVSGDALPAAERVAFLNAIVGLAKTLHMQSVAEGIEDTDQLDELRRLGCDVGQGYLWGRPTPEPAIAGELAMPHLRAS